MIVNPQPVPVGEGYEIKIKGHLDECWADWFNGLTFVHEQDDANGKTNGKR